MKLLVILLSFTWIELGVSQGTLQRLQVVFRHGYRAPTTFYWANETCFNKSQTGQLTEKGIRQMEILGYFLRARYDQFLGDFTDNMTVFSSDSERCVQSAHLVANATFSLNNVSDAQVFLMPRDMDGPMALDNNYFYKYWPTSYPQKKDYQALFDKVQKDVSVNTSIDLIYVADQILCELAERCDGLPASLAQNQKELLQMDQDFYSSFRNCDSKDIIYNNTNVIRQNIINIFNTSYPAYQQQNRTTLYASHDDDMATLLSRMGVFDGKHVPFGAAIYFELHEINNINIVRIFYDIATDHSLTQLRLPDCDLDCPFETFVSLTETFRICSKASRLSVVFMLTLLSVVCTLFRNIM